MKIKLDKTKKFLGNFLLITAKQSFLSCLFLFVLALIFGGFLFCQYIIKAQTAKIEITEKPFLLNEETHQEVLRIWQVREKKFSEADSKEYSNPFRELIKN